MKIYRVDLPVYEFAKMKKFYTKLLQMEQVFDDEETFVVQAGATKICFKKSEIQPYYHICFRLGPEYFDVMFNRLKEKGLLLANEDGDIQMDWKGKQAYFYDPDGNILEMLERPFRHGDEDPKSWHDVGEVGLPSDDIYKLSGFLAPYVENQFTIENDRFSFFGDEDGVCVLVKSGRNWYPTNRPAEIHPIKLIVGGITDTQIKHPILPYEIIVRKEWNSTLPSVQFRIARPTNQIEKLIEFYGEGLGLVKVGDFQKHEGYEGVMFGLPDREYHLEFTQHESGSPIPKPSEDQLLVFYIPDPFKWQEKVKQLLEMGYQQVTSENPYWDRGGVTIMDPDGYRVVLMNTSGI